MREIFLIDKLEYSTEYAEYTDVLGNKWLDGNNKITRATNLSKFVFTAEDLVTDYNEKMVEDIVERYIGLFTERGMRATEPQINFARETSKILLGKLINVANIPVIPAPCGFGKSTINQVFLEVVCLAYREGIIEDGIIIVTDKLEQLYALHDDLIEAVGYYVNTSLKNKSENTPFTYVMEGWKDDSYERGVCLNKDVKYYEYGMCSSAKCPNFGQCKICNQKYEQLNSPILLMTNARLETCAEGINFYATYTDKTNEKQPRTLRIIDEKPTMRNNFKVNTNILSEILLSLENGIDKIQDKIILIDKWDKITQNIRAKFTDFNENDRIIVSNINNAPVLLNDIEFTTLWEKHMGKNKYKRELQHIHTVLTIGGLFVNGGKRGRWIETIGMKTILNENFKTVIYDGTALIDQDYSNEEIIRFLDIENLRTFENVTFNFHMNTKLTKTNFNASNYLDKGCAKFLETVKKENTYVVTHKEQATPILNEIRKKNKTLTVNLKDDAKTWGAKRPNIITFSENKLAYYGNTKGSNIAKDCTQMVAFGWSVLPDYEYLIRYLCTKYEGEDLDKLFRDCANIEKSKNIIDLFIENKGKLPLYKNYCMLVDFIQEVFRTALRKYDCTDNITIECFQCSKVLVGMIKQMFPKCHSHPNYDEELECFSVAKIENRETKDGKETHAQKIMKWVDNTWDGEEIKTKDMLLSIGITQKQFDKSKEVNSNLREILSKYMFKRGIYKKVA